MTPESILDRLRTFGPVYAVKLYRLSLAEPAGIPTLPCLDHEAMLHEGIDPHVAAYLEDAATGDLHEVVFLPGRARIEIDAVSTWGESSPASLARLRDSLARDFPGWRIGVAGPSWWRGDRRVSTACRAQVSLRDVLTSTDFDTVTRSIARLQTVAALMEKESRVASWGVRTVTGPLLAAAGVVTFIAIGSLHIRLGEATMTGLRYLVVGLMGAAFLYYGLKAVQLTEMSNRVWKRTAEYGLIIAERKRLRS